MAGRLRPQGNLTNCRCGSKVDNAAHSRQCFSFKHLLYVSACYSCKVLTETEMLDLLHWHRWSRISGLARLRVAQRFGLLGASSGMLWGGLTCLERSQGCGCLANLSGVKQISCRHGSLSTIWSVSGKKKCFPGRQEGSGVSSPLTQLRGEAAGGFFSCLMVEAREGCTAGSWGRVPGPRAMPGHREVRQQVLLLELGKDEHIPATPLSLEMPTGGSWRGSQPGNVGSAWEGTFWGSVTNGGAASCCF